jgi:hypothetical protein
MSPVPPKHYERHTLIVRVGVLTQAEFSQLSPAERAEVEDGTRDLLARYGPEFFIRERDRLREELSICGFLNESFEWWSPSFQRERNRGRNE